MNTDYSRMPGRSITSTELTIDRALALAQFLESSAHTYAQLIDIVAPDDNALGTEAIIVDVEVERGQHVVHEIHRRERVAVIFAVNDAEAPAVFALRSTFPRDVSHLYLYDADQPPRLCIYEDPWDDVRLSWTPVRFVERIREWLARTAAGTLHAADQPLPPFLLGTYSPLIMPIGLLAKREDEGPYYFNVRKVDGGLGRTIHIVEPVEHGRSDQRSGEHLATVFHAAPRQQSSLRWRPNSLAELQPITEQAGLDLLVELRSRLRSWQSNPEIGEILDLRLMIIVVLPRLRSVDDEQPEWPDIWAFSTTIQIRDVGDRIDAWQIQDDSVGHLLVPDESKRGQDIDLEPLRPHFALESAQAARYSGISPSSTPAIAAVGVGALGSQLFVNLMRMGWGTWTLIDDDYVLPHNLVRHALDGSALGLPKVEQLVSLARATFPYADPVDGIVANVLHPLNQSEHLARKLQEVELILDLSASVPVARYLGRDAESHARRASLFLNPSGSDLVLLAEDNARSTTLDSLEMQYYRALIADRELVGHLHRDVGPIRYAQSCRDVSTVLSQDRVALHAAIGSRTVRDLQDDDTARGTIWRAGDDGCVTRIDLPVYRTVEVERPPWWVISDEGLLGKVAKARRDRLPNETGGVLLGAFDLERKIIYVADVIFSPPDSREWPTMYIRGARGLQEQIEHAQGITHRMLEYVGEWHSHPSGRGPAPSATDRQAFITLNQVMMEDGLPPVMLIVGHDGEAGWHVGSMC